MPKTRRLLSSGLVLVVLGTALAGSAAAVDPPAAIKMPNPDCVTFTDPKGDTIPKDNAVSGKDPDLDLTWVTFASPPGKIRVFIHVDVLGTPRFIGHAFSARFLLKDKDLVLQGGKDAAPFDSVPREVNKLPIGQPLSKVFWNYQAVPGAVMDQVFDKASSTVILTTDRAPIEAVSGGSLADGVTLPAVTVESWNDSINNFTLADSAPDAPATATYTMGDNHCFIPPQGFITLTAPTAAVYGHPFTVSGVLKDEKGKLIAGKKVTVTIAGRPVDVTTDANGAISQVIPGTLNAAGYDITAAFVGDDDLQAANALARINVKLAPTSMALTSAVSGKLVIVKTQLLNDVKAPMAGQSVVWSVDGKVVKTTKTDSAGKTSFTTAPRHTIKASFAGVTGRYAASTATKKI